MCLLQWFTYSLFVLLCAFSNGLHTLCLFLCVPSPNGVHTISLFSQKQMVLLRCFGFFLFFSVFLDPESLRDGLNEAEKNLYDQLVELRRTEALARNVPAYIVFWNKTLIALARYRPTEPHHFQRIEGVAEHALVEYGHAFMQLISSFCSTHQLPANLAPPSASRALSPLSSQMSLPPPLERALPLTPPSSVDVDEPLEPPPRSDFPVMVPPLQWDFSSPTSISSPSQAASQVLKTHHPRLVSLTTHVPFPTLVPPSSSSSSSTLLPPRHGVRVVGGAQSAADANRNACKSEVTSDSLVAKTEADAAALDAVPGADVSDGTHRCAPPPPLVNVVSSLSDPPPTLAASSLCNGMNDRVSLIFPRLSLICSLC